MKWRVVRCNNNDPDSEIHHYEARNGKIVLAMIEKYQPPNNSHYAVWELTIYMNPPNKTPCWSSNFSTKRDAQNYFEKNPRGFVQ